MNNPEKLAVLGTHDTSWRQTHQKTYHYTQANTNNTNM